MAVEHYENTPMQNTAIFHGCENDNFQLIFSIFIFLLKTYIVVSRYNRHIDAVLTSTHNICFRAKIKKNNVYPCKPQFYYIKVGCTGL